MRRERHTKIVATIGPASSQPDQIRALLLAGADVFRLNFSHGSHKDHQSRYQAIRALEAEMQHPIGILLDLQGPKLRVGNFATGYADIVAGQSFSFDLDATPGDSLRAPLLHPEIYAAVSPGDLLLVDDGKLRFTVVSCTAHQCHTIALNAGVISNRKGVNVPSAILPLSALTDKDRIDLAFGLELGVDWIALSFVQSAADIEELRGLVGGRASLMAKLEKPSAIEQLDQIIAVADGVMVARGDLGVEMPPEDVPGLQKGIVHACRQAGKPVIVATQMLESMISSPTPTRAEASDVATAVYDGADAVMLSAESASGAYPVEAVRMMSRIIAAGERDLQRQPERGQSVFHRSGNATDAVCAGLRAMAQVLPPTAIVAYTTSGSTSLRMAHERSWTPVLSLTPDVQVARMLALVWGVHSLQMEQPRNVDDMILRSAVIAHEQGFNAQGRPIVIVAGTPVGVSGTTNLLRLVWPEEVLAATPTRNRRTAVRKEPA
ncbi:pyruvate kinase [Herbaspirillum sp. YR522]|uniref:pyruvate kinase n=1 Tax=Herbaspirillum sp. YR522 TaxID=1144342 RepID=UPI0012F7BBE8|nr:pyruvate kinase [Herbaspirillum sp. YR522]